LLIGVGGKKEIRLAVEDPKTLLWPFVKGFTKML